jgi:hypothetical protein
MKTTASEFDEKFNKGESVIDDFNLSKARRPEEEQKRVTLIFRFG